jgi:hypothetical protein
MSLEQLCDEVARAVESGMDPEAVLEELIESFDGLTDDERAGLWLFAWSYAARLARSARRPLGGVWS